MGNIRHKIFISYHHTDKDEVNDFIEEFDVKHDVFIARALGAGMSDDIINSTDVSYVMHRIRELYLRDSTVTVVLIGKCTWARRYVDWEIQSSLRKGETITPNGLLGIKLPSYDGEGYPYRLNKNLNKKGELNEVYARVINYPSSKDTLITYIEDAFSARKDRENI